VSRASVGGDGDETNETTLVGRVRCDRLAVGFTPAGIGKSGEIVSSSHVAAPPQCR
jgi:hypothetical protein